MVLFTVAALTTFTSLVALPLHRAELRGEQQNLERAQAEQALRRASALHEAALRCLGEGLYTIDERGLVTSINPAAEELFGWTFSELRGKKMHDVTHHHHRDGTPFPSSECAGLQVLRLGRPLKNHEDVFIRKDGTFFDVIYSSAPLRDADGGIAGLVVVFSDITERRRAEAERERQMREVVENAPQAIAMLDTAMRYREVSPRWLRDFGLTPNVIGERHDDLLPEIPGHWKAVHQRCLAGATEENDGERFVRRDGTVQWVRWKACPWRDAAGAIGGILIYAEDITRQRQVEEAARAIEGRLRLAQQVARVGAFEWNIRTGVNTWTPELEAMYGLRPGGFGGTQPAWEMLVHPDDRAQAARSVATALETGAPVEGEWRVVWPDGSTHWLTGRFQVLRDETGEPLSLVGVNIETTERKRAEQEREALLNEIRGLSRDLELRVQERTRELAVARDRLAGVISLAADAIISVGEDERIAIFNRGAEQIFGWARDEVLGRPLDVLIPERLRGAHIASLAGEPTEARRMGDRRAVLGLRKNGEEFPAEAAISRQPSDSGLLFTVILRDVTERDRLEAERSRTYAERAVLLKEIHHRVKNNLQVLSSLFYLQAQRADHAAIRRLLDESRGRIQSIALIHEKLYQSERLAQIDFGDYLGDLTRSVLRAIGDQAPNVATRIEAANVFVDIEHAIPCALIVNELLSNAMKHAFPAGRRGEVQVRVRCDGSSIELEVADDGIGLAANLDLASVTTLGMQLVMSLTKQLRGTLELVREGGTTVRVRFPVTARARPAAGRPELGGAPG
jgi:PAS domain S-box-containing protein